jgi:hypothetical protein
MRKTERELRNWVLHLNSRLVRRGAVYSLHMKDGLGRACDRVDFQKLNEIEPWLLEGQANRAVVAGTPNWQTQERNAIMLWQTSLRLQEICPPARNRA